MRRKLPVNFLNSKWDNRLTVYACFVQVITAFVGGIDCEVNTGGNSLLFSFQDIQKPELTEISIQFTNFINPWSAISIQSIRVSSYISSDCSGDQQSSQDLSPLSFEQQLMPATQVDITSSSTVLGDHLPSNIVTFKFTPSTTMSRSGRGTIRI